LSQNFDLKKYGISPILKKNQNNGGIADGTEVDCFGFSAVNPVV
jgi:hypothetical protein